MSNTTPHYLFLTTSTRESGHLGNTEWLAQQAAAALPAGTVQTWHHLARMSLPPFVDLRHTVGTYPAPEGDLKTLLDATLAATHIVFVSPVYWFSIPSPLKTYLDHWSGWMRVPGLPFKEQMAAKSLFLITTSGPRQGPADDRLGGTVRQVPVHALGRRPVGQGRAARCGAGGCAGCGTGRALFAIKIRAGSAFQISARA